MYLKKISIKKIIRSAQKPFVDKAKKILVLKNKGLNKDVEEIEDQIDDLVFDLYELTPEEREIVLEGS